MMIYANTFAERKNAELGGVCAKAKGYGNQRGHRLICDHQLFLKKQNKTSAGTLNVVRDRMSNLPFKARQTLTLDNGPEWSSWEALEKATGLSCFFAHPYRSSERGANENANGLLREYFPKKTDFSTISDEELAAVEYRLNTRPRKRLGWRTPLEVWSVALQG